MQIKTDEHNSFYYKTSREKWKDSYMVDNLSGKTRAHKLCLEGKLTVNVYLFSRLF